MNKVLSVAWGRLVTRFLRRGSQVFEKSGVNVPIVVKKAKRRCIYGENHSTWELVCYLKATGNSGNNRI